MGTLNETIFKFTEEITVPKEVRISMSQNLIDNCDPLVEVGDKVKVGQEIGLDKKYPASPICSSVSGTVKAIEEATMASGLTTNTIVIESDGKQEICENISIPQISSKTDLIREIQKSGTIGTAGESFLNHVNIDSLLAGKIETFIINGTEFNDYTDLEKHMILEDTDWIIKTISEMEKYLSIKKYYICLSADDKDAIEKMKYDLKSADLYNVEVVPLETNCPPGSNRVIVFETMGEIVPADNLVESIGVAVTNINSMYYIGRYLSTGMPLITKRLTVSGSAFKEEKEVVAPLGTPISDIVEFCGGYISKPEKIYLGGAMLGRPIDNDNYPLEKNNNFILAYQEDHPGIREEISCEECDRCRRVCPENLLPHKLYDAFENKDAKKLSELGILKCTSCGRCSFVCPARKPLTFLHDVAKGFVRD